MKVTDKRVFKLIAKDHPEWFKSPKLKKRNKVNLLMTTVILTWIAFVIYLTLNY